ncbi:MAG: hypothetical protein RIC35_14405 [Marinoscillum sp.]
MRLGQLARKLEIKTSDIVQYLAEKSIEVKDHPNVKLDEANQQDVIDHFGGFEEEPIPEVESKEEVSTQKEPDPEVKEEVIDDQPTTDADQVVEVTLDQEKEEDDVEITPGVVEEELPETETIEVAARKSITVSELRRPTSEDDDPDGVSEFDEKLLSGIDVIKAPKVELPGLKVVGKIDLPQPVEKIIEEDEEQPEPNDGSTETTEPTIIRHDQRNKRKRLTPEDREARRLRNKKAKEKRLAKEEQRLQQQEEQRIKDLRKQHYKKKLAQPTPTNKKVKKKTKVVQNKIQKPKPKSALGKFWRWLNT